MISENLARTVVETLTHELCVAQSSSPNGVWILRARVPRKKSRRKCCIPLYPRRREYLMKEMVVSGFKCSTKVKKDQEMAI